MPSTSDPVRTTVVLVVSIEVIALAMTSSPMASVVRSANRAMSHAAVSPPMTEPSPWIDARTAKKPAVRPRPWSTTAKMAVLAKPGDGRGDGQEHRQLRQALRRP